MLGKKNQSALLAKYFSLYKKNPRSKVFAPLAESFRKLGMMEDAYKILKEGIRNHPTYTLGYIVLAHCYYDQEKYELTYNTLRPIISQNADNISLQKIFAQACIHLGHLEEALDTYKYLLFMNPRDKFFADQVKRLEDDLLIGHKRISLEQLIKAPNLPTVISREVQDDDWVQVDFAKNETPNQIEKKLEIPTSDEWVMKKSSNVFDDNPILKQETIEKRSLDDDFYADEFEEEHGDIEEINAASVTSEEPIVSHTLIDLYCTQHYYDKAIELLERILELNPDDLGSLKKLDTVRELKSHHDKNPIPKNPTEEDGHNELISIIENKVKVKSPKEIKVQEAFHSFLDSLKSKSLQYR